MSEIKGSAPSTIKDSCMVVMDGKTTASTDFVAILARDSGDTSIYYNTDALTLGMAIKLIAKEFIHCISNCTPAEQDHIKAILGDAFILERFANEEH